MLERARKRLRKRAKRGLRGYPVATVALYGPDDTRATKLTVGIVPAEDAEATDLRRWFSEGADIRNDAGVAEEVLAFIDAAGARSIVMTDRIIGCRHEEGIDTKGPPVRRARSGLDAIAGLASAYTRLNVPDGIDPRAGPNVRFGAGEAGAIASVVRWLVGRLNRELPCGRCPLMRHNLVLALAAALASFACLEPASIAETLRCARFSREELLLRCRHRIPVRSSA